jgi:hypothetical protein
MSLLTEYLYWNIVPTEYFILEYPYIGISVLIEYFMCYF